MEDSIFHLLVENTPGVFTPVSALFGGALIGLGASVLLLFEGAIAGISGILGRSLQCSGAERSWRLAFLLGIPMGTFLLAQLTPETTAVEIPVSALHLILAGILVGVGTQLGSGCTSGHGVCGIARGSKRSISATLVFMFFGFLTVAIVRHWCGGLMG